MSTNIYHFKNNWLFKQDKSPLLYQGEYWAFVKFNILNKYQ